MTQAFEPDAKSDERSIDLDLGTLGSAISAKRNWIIVPTALAFLLSAAFVTVVKPSYTAEAEVLLENQENFFTSPGRSEVQPQQEGLDTDLVGSQIQVITSTDLARRAVEQLGLVGNPEFDPYAKGLGVIPRLLALFHLARDPMQIPAEDRVIATFEQHLSAYSPLKTRAIIIQFSSHDPALATRATNAIADIYLGMNSSAKREIAKQAAVSLAAQIAELRIKVTHASDEVERYRASSGLLAGTNNMTISGQQLADLNGELSHARSDMADSQAKATLIREMLRQGRIAEVPDVANNDLIRRIAEQLVTAKAQLALESGALLPGHPRIKELNAEIANLEVQLQTTAENTAQALENNSKIAAARVANLEAAIDQQTKTVVLSDADEVHLHELEATAQALRDQLNSSLTKYQVALASANSTSTPADARIIARATPPQEPSFPKKLPTVALGTIAAFVFSLGAVVASELLTDQPQSPGSAAQPRPLGNRRKPSLEQIASRLRQFGTSRREAADEGAEISEDAGDEIDDDGFGGKVVARATSPQGVQIVATRISHSETANTTLIGFVRNLARDGRPIVVDLDSQTKQVAPLFDAQEDAGNMLGLTDLFEGRASISEVIHRDCTSRLHFVPFGSGEEFDPDDLDMILDALAQTYDFVVLAAPPLATSEMPKALAPYADFVVLAAPKIHEADARAACADLKAAGAADVLMIEDEEAAA
ncbi:MAG: exopolysaccharide transport family protein [Methylovirgula sp.]